jgi:hypothetical protein
MDFESVRSNEHFLFRIVGQRLPDFEGRRNFVKDLASE